MIGVVAGMIGTIGVAARMIDVTSAVGADVASIDVAGVAMLFLVGFACTTASKIASKLQSQAIRLGIKLLAGMVQTHTVNELEGVD